MINSIILAGKSSKGLEGKKNKGLIDINGKPMLLYVIDALKKSDVVDRIVIVSDPEDLKNINLVGVEKVIKDAGTMIDNIIKGVEYFKSDSRVMITTCDIPLLTGEAVRDFVKKAMDSKADLCYPIVDKESCERKYPDTKRTYARLKEGTFTGGNLFIINPKILDRSINKAKQMIQYRKKPIKMSKVLGFRFLIKFIAGRLTIDAVEERVSSILNVKPKAIISPYPEIGNDVDKLEDIKMVRKYLESDNGWSRDKEGA
jgi:GTP:adenosylcobinamide-phosphate guanylyltransferase